MSSRASISQKEQKLLWGLAAARCSFPNCRTVCVARGDSNDPHAIFGEVAHIHSWSDDGPRANASLSSNERNLYDNLILLCANHHSVVDAQESKYDANSLREFKRNHEQWVERSLAETMSAVSFSELEMVTQSILSVAVPPTGSFTLTTPKEKIEKNGLSSRSTQRIRLGMVKAREVEDFVRDASKLNASFPERLTQGFVAKYNELREQNYSGDSLFSALQDFAANNSPNFERQTAGLAVLVYLFEKCEIFER